MSRVISHFSVSLVVFNKTKNMFLSFQSFRVILKTAITMVTHAMKYTGAPLLSSPLIIVPITTALGNDSAERAAAMKDFFSLLQLNKDYGLDRYLTARYS